MEHHFNTELAKDYGILEAVIIDHLSFWILKNKANDCNLYDGTYWTFSSIKALSELFVYSSERQIRYAIDNLIKAEIIQTGNFNKLKYDRTKWYSFTLKGIELLKKHGIDLTPKNDKNVNSILQNCQMNLTELSNECDENVEPIPDTYKDTYKDTIKEKSIKEKTQKRFRAPTVEEVKAYCQERKNNIDPEHFVDYYTSKGWTIGKNAPMKDWKSAVRTWEKRTKDFDSGKNKKNKPELSQEQQRIVDNWL